MGKKRRFSRLGMKLVGVSVLGLALAFVVFYLVDSVAAPWVFYSETFTSFWESRNEAAVQAYQDYVTEHGLTVQQVIEQRDEGLDQVTPSVVYTLMAETSWDAAAPAGGGSALPARPAAGLEAGASDEAEGSYSFIWAGLTDHADVDSTSMTSVSIVMTMREIQCADGVVYISPTPAALQYAGLGRAVGLLLALAGFCLVVVPYIVRLLRRVGELSREAGVLRAGDLEHSISIQGNDELSGLGEDIERLRRSVLERIQGEREAVAANSGLITSLSHDLRTPLTKLTGYLDILTYHKYQTPEEHDAFLRMASEKAEQIKTLTDQMFVSAQVNAAQIPVEPEIVDGAALLGQLLEEQCGDLRREGFVLDQPPVFDREFQLYLRTGDAVRIFDNLFSNLRKYADPAAPIRIRVEDGLEKVILRVENQIRPILDCADSHGVGVPTMRDLLKRAGGSLEVSLDGGRYESVLTFPKCVEEK